MKKKNYLTLVMISIFPILPLALIKIHNYFDNQYQCVLTNITNLEYNLDSVFVKPVKLKYSRYYERYSRSQQPSILSIKHQISSDNQEYLITLNAEEEFEDSIFWVSSIIVHEINFYLPYLPIYEEGNIIYKENFNKTVPLLCKQSYGF